MADFNFGLIGAAIEAAKTAADNVNISPIDTTPLVFMDQDFTSYVANADQINTIYGAPDDFVWGQKWGNSKTRVAE
ncbi:MAG: hypothetical protein WC119_01755 [Synergistaceae bacterium]